MDVIYLLVDAALVFGLAVWMVVAVADNWRHPQLNEEAVAMVLRFDFMARDYPAEYQHVAYRRIDDPVTIRRMFQAIRAAETLAALALLISGTALVLAAFGAVSVDVATAMAVLSAAFFSLVWAGFVIGGNYFAYWYSHQWGQSNHFMLMFWGFFVLLVLLV